MSSTMSKSGLARYLALSLRSQGVNGWELKLTCESLKARNGFAVYRIRHYGYLKTALTEYNTYTQTTVRVRL